MSLALATLRHDWRRFLPGVLSVAFSGLLMLIQLGLLMGLFGTVTVLVDRSTADLWVSSPETASFDQSREIPSALAADVRSIAAVQASERLSIRDADWRSVHGQRLLVSLVGLEPRADALACPHSPVAVWCEALNAPMSAVVDTADLEKLGAVVGERVQINGQRVQVIAAAQGLRSIGSALVFVSAQTARRLSPSDSSQGEKTSFVLAQLAPGADLERVQKSLQVQLRRSVFRVWTGSELSAASQRYWLEESGVGAGFLFSSLLGVVIGVVITSQTLRAAVLGSVREYAAFRAMGVPAQKLGAVVIEQSLWIALAGILLTLIVSALVYALAMSMHVPLVLTVEAILAAALIGLLTAVGSGVFALRELYRLEPAELLR